MSYLDLHTIKAHLSIEEQEDSYDFMLMGMRDAAEEALAKTLDCDLTQLQDANGCLPKALNHAMLMLIAHWFNCRESVSGINYTEVPLAFNYLCALFHDYKPVDCK